MTHRLNLARALAVVAALGIGSCSRFGGADPNSTQAKFRRYVLVPAENLTPDKSLDWASGVIPQMIASSLEGLSGVAAGVAPNRYDGPGRPRGEFVYCRYEGPVTMLSLTCWADGNEQVWNASGALSDGLTKLTSAIAKTLDARARPVEGVSNEALQAYAENRFEDAIAASPNFGLAYANGAERARLRGDRSAAERLIAAGLARGESLGAGRLARLELQRAVIADDAQGQAVALRKLVEIESEDADKLKALANLELGLKNFPQAVAAFEKLAQLNPADQSAWNDLGYARAYAGNLAGGKQAIEKYRELAPNEPNPLDSLGEIHYYSGRFAEAEAYFRECQTRFPQFLGGVAQSKAALARWQAGDKAEAAKMFQAYIEASGGNADALGGVWSFLQGDAAKAEAAMKDAAAESTGDAAARYWAHAAIWARLRGDEKASQDAARKSMPAAQSGPARFLAFVAMFTAQPRASAEEWRLRADRALPGANVQPVRQSVLALALLFDKHFAAAEPLLRDNFRRAPAANDLEARTMLAWSLAEQGKKDEAAKLLTVHGLPPALGASPIDAIVLAKAASLRAAR